MPYYDGFGRRGRFGVQATAPVAMPYADVTAPRLRPMDRGPTESEQPNINTPGGYATSLRQAGVSGSYATKLALQRDRAQQGSMNTYSPQARADIYSAPATGTAFFSPIRQGMNAMTRGANANANLTEQMTAPLVQGQNYSNQFQNIQNQYAPAGFQADIDNRNARTMGMVGDEKRAQGVYDLTAPSFGPRATAEVDQIKAKTGQIGADTEAVQRDYENNLRTEQSYRKQAEQSAATYQKMVDDLNAQLRAMQAELARYRTGGGIGGDGFPVEPNQQAAPIQQPAQQPMQQQQGGKQLDAGTAQQFLQQAGGDKNKARQLARAAGYTF